MRGMEGAEGKEKKTLLKHRLETGIRWTMNRFPTLPASSVCMWGSHVTCHWCSNKISAERPTPLVLSNKWKQHSVSTPAQGHLQLKHSCYILTLSVPDAHQTERCVMIPDSSINSLLGSVLKLWRKSFVSRQWRPEQFACKLGSSFVKTPNCYQKSANHEIMKLVKVLFPWWCLVKKLLEPTGSKWSK